MLYNDNGNTNHTSSKPVNNENGWLKKLAFRISIPTAELESIGVFSPKYIPNKKRIAKQKMMEQAKLMATFLSFLFLSK